MNNMSQTDRQAIPILSKLPIIGNLFKSKAERAEQTELMVLITPRLVRPLDPDEVPPLPTRPEEFIDPSGDEEKPSRQAWRMDRQLAGHCAARRPPLPARGRQGPPRSGKRSGPQQKAENMRRIQDLQPDRIGARRGAGPRRDRAGRADGLQHLRHRLRRAVGGAPAGAELPPTPARWRARFRWAIVDMDDQALARRARSTWQRLNEVWGEAPDITDRATSPFPLCPPGSPGAGTNACIRVDVFRNQRAGGNPLPTFFGTARRRHRAGRPRDRDGRSAVRRFDRLRQAVRDSRQVAGASATTWARRAGAKTTRSSATCRTATIAAQLLTPADYYESPGAPGGQYGPNGTGFTRESVGLGGGDYGRRIMLKAGNPQSGDRAGLVPPGRDQSDRGTRRRRTTATTSRRAIRR